VECAEPGVVLTVRFEKTVSIGVAKELNLVLQPGVTNGLVKEWNLVLQCGVTVWLMNGISFALCGYGLADGLDVLLKH